MPPSPSATPAPSSNTFAIPDVPPTSTSPDLPLTLASSLILTSLPQDAASALHSAGDFPLPKIIVHFKAVGAAPILEKKVCKINSSQRFEAVVSYLRRVLRVRESESVFLYVNSSFAPALDEVVGNLHRVSGVTSSLRSLERISEAEGTRE
jgi:ubiquitin-like protein ATG12